MDRTNSEHPGRLPRQEERGGETELTAALRASEERLRSLLESAVDAIIVIDERGTIEAFNPGAERLFGYHKAEAIGRNVKMLMPSPDREQHDAYVSRYLATGQRRIIGIGRDVIGMRKDGTTFPVHLSVGEMVIGGVRSEASPASCTI
jgi:two-component system sensor kinase FixL